MKPKDVLIPQYMLNCKLDRRTGFPVPYVVYIDEHGDNHFKINDQEKSLECVVFNKCAICGNVLAENDRWLLGGIASAFDEHGAYIDLPIHQQCGEYALQVCPYLAYRNYIAKIDMAKLQQKLPNVALNNPTVDTDRLPVFVFIRPTAIEIKVWEGDIRVYAKQPYLNIQFWADGFLTNPNQALWKIEGTKWEKYTPAIHKTMDEISKRINKDFYLPDTSNPIIC